MPDMALEAALPGLVAGVDEVGRGPLCGPVVAAAVIFAQPLAPELAARIDDSKKLSEKSRDALFAQLRQSGALIAVAAASVAEIERLNILHASLLAMRRAVERLPLAPAWALVDGNKAPQLACQVQCVVGGDAKSLSIAAASIIAKVVRDRGMARLDRRWPGYGWAANAGYPTATHLAALERLGPTPHHRMGFGPLKQMARVENRKLSQNRG
jgi:ribonuclease HII